MIFENNENITENKNGYRKVAKLIFIGYCIVTVSCLAFVEFGGCLCEWCLDHGIELVAAFFQSVFMFGIGLGGISMILYPFVGGIAFLIVSILGIIQDRKFIPYLIYSVISIILWFITICDIGRYI